MNIKKIFIPLGVILLVFAICVASSRSLQNWLSLADYHFSETHIEFYGKLVDVYGNPVTDTVVVYSIKNQNADEGRVVSDSSGYISIKGKGHYLSLRNPTYPEESKWKIYGLFDYTGFLAASQIHKPDKNQPVDIVCLDQSIQYIDIKKNFYFDWAEGEQSYHLINKDLGIDETFSFSGTKAQVNENGRYTWKVRLKSEHKILYKSSKKLYLAPTTGYTDEIIFEMNENNEHWFDSMNYENVYVKFKNGKYAKLSVKINMNQGDRALQLKLSINPNGEREVAPTF